MDTNGNMDLPLVGSGADGLGALQLPTERGLPLLLLIFIVYFPAHTFACALMFFLGFSLVMSYFCLLFFFFVTPIPPVFFFIALML
jgi:hypothetical protein